MRPRQRFARRRNGCSGWRVSRPRSVRHSSKLRWPPLTQGVRLRLRRRRATGPVAVLVEPRSSRATWSSVGTAEGRSTTRAGSHVPTRTTRSTSTMTTAIRSGTCARATSASLVVTAMAVAIRSVKGTRSSAVMAAVLTTTQGRSRGRIPTGRSTSLTTMATKSRKYARRTSGRRQRRPKASWRTAPRSRCGTGDRGSPFRPRSTGVLGLTSTTSPTMMGIMREASLVFEFSVPGRGRSGISSSAGKWMQCATAVAIAPGRSPRFSEGGSTRSRSIMARGKIWRGG
mmetsp:Transcript_36244/g.62771  ORF Transcript_36244/g.62771 Transcript_36244/m.62771 type:complete len:286 (+) Transcript_36244:810-1667(+)